MSRFGKSNNPMIKEKVLKGPIERYGGGEMSNSMTVAGAVNKTLILFAILMVTTVISYIMPTPFLLYTGMIGGLILYFWAIFKPHKAPILAPAYAGFEGMFVGTISAIYAAQFAGIVFQAISLTFATLFMMLMIYKSGLIKVTQKFRAGVVMATGAVFLVYIISLVGNFVGFNVPLIHEGGIMGIGITVVIIGVAAMNLLLDFDNFEKGEAMQAPKYMEWFFAMSLMVTLVWLYVEFLRLLSKLRE